MKVTVKYQQKGSSQTDLCSNTKISTQIWTTFLTVHANGTTIHKALTKHNKKSWNTNKWVKAQTITTITAILSNE